MPRTARRCPAGYAYHVWNRAAGRLRLFKKPNDYLAFNRILLEAHERHPIDLLDWCLMPNHWHFVVYPRRDDNEVTAFFRWLTHTHAMRSITHRRVIGMGPLYQGRFKSLPVEQDEHLARLLRYVERNPLRAGLVKRASQWRWSGAAARRDGPDELAAILSTWPIDRPADWERWVNEPQTQAETETLRECVRRSRPFGGRAWTQRVAGKLDLGWTLRPRGRPPIRKNEKELRPLLSILSNERSIATAGHAGLCAGGPNAPAQTPPAGAGRSRRRVACDGSVVEGAWDLPPHGGVVLPAPNEGLFSAGRPGGL